MARYGAYNEANTNEYWGFNNWEANSQKNIVCQTKYDGEGVRSKVVLRSGTGRFRIEDKNLYFNSGIDGTSSLGEIAPYHRIN